MIEVFAAGLGGDATAEERFLRHYLAQRLNQESLRQHPAATHDFTTITLPVRGSFVQYGLVVLVALSFKYWMAKPQVTGAIKTSVRRVWDRTIWGKRWTAFESSAKMHIKRR